MAPSVSSSADLTARDFIPVQGAVSTNKLTPITIVGIVIAALLGVGAALWVAIRWYRKRQTRNRGDKRASAFLNVRGVSKEGEEPKEVQGPRCVVHSFTRFVRSYFSFQIRYASQWCRFVCLDVSCGGFIWVSSFLGSFSVVRIPVIGRQGVAVMTPVYIISILSLFLLRTINP